MKIKFLLFALLATVIINAQKVENTFLVNPYLQIGYNPSPNSLQLLWHTDDADANWLVEYNNSNAWIKADSITFKKVAIANVPTHRVYQATFNKLVAGSLFNYRVSKNGKEVFAAQAHAPKAFNQPYKMVVFGDIGAGTKEAKEIANGVYKANADIVLVPGDIVYDNGLIKEYNTRFWPIYNTIKVDTVGVPLMSTSPFIGAVGNHDADTRDLNKYPDALAYYYYWQQPLNGPIGKEGGAITPVLTATDANRKAFTDAAGEAYPRMTNFSYNYGNAHWLVIDADVYVDWTDKELLEWVAKDLANAKDAEWRFVLFHHPGFNSSIDHYEQQQMRLLAPVFEKGNVDVVFNGHVHNYQRSYPLTFKPFGRGTLMVGGKDGKAPRGRVVPGAWTLDKSFDGTNNTKPKGIIYLVTGAGGQDLYNPEQQDDKDSWQPFTNKFISKVHTFTIADVNGKTLSIKQVTAEGKEVDSFKITH
jgi:predicted phosphodiesterase